MVLGKKEIQYILILCIVPCGSRSIFIKCQSYCVILTCTCRSQNRVEEEQLVSQICYIM